MAKRRTNPKHRKPTVEAAVLVFSLAGAVAVAYGAWYRPALSPVSATKASPKLVHVRHGMSAVEVATMLERSRLVRSRLATLVYLATTGRAGKLKAGYYDLAPSMSTPEIVDAVVCGKIAHRTIVVAPGLTLEQIAERAEQSGLATKEDFLAAAATATDFRGEVSFPLPEGRSVEGYLFPATYSFPVGISCSGMVVRMLRAFEENFYKPYCAEIADSPIGLHGVVTLASLVEREAAVDDERPVIAGVLMNRLRLGWKLQCDATVQYALKRHKRRLLFDDLKVPSEYNTYLHRGLPPGPICSPGLKSLVAALRPAKHRYLFYVASGNKRHIFTSSYAQHLAAIEHLRKKGLRP